MNTENINKLKKTVNDLSKLYLHQKYIKNNYIINGGAINVTDNFINNIATNNNNNNNIKQLTKDIYKKGYMTLDDAIKNIYLRRVNKNI